MQKKLVAFILAFVLLFGMSMTASAETAINSKTGISIVINGVVKSYSVPIISISDNTFLPLRAMAVDLGIPNDNKHIIWNAKTGSIQLITSDGKKKISLTINKKTATLNGKSFTLEVAPLLYNDNTYVPVRFIAEALDKKVVWYENTKTVYIRGNADYAKSLAWLNSFVNSLYNSQNPMRISTASNSTLTSTSLNMVDSSTIDFQLDYKNHKVHINETDVWNGQKTRTDTWMDGKNIYVYKDNKATCQNSSLFTIGGYYFGFSSEALKVNDNLLEPMAAVFNVKTEKNGDISIDAGLPLAGIINNSNLSNDQYFNSDNYKLSSFYYILTFDSKTKLPKKMQMSYIDSFTLSGDPAKYSYKSSSDYSFVGNYNADIPDYVKNGATTIG